MKKIIMLSVLLSAFVIWQGCRPEKQDSATEFAASEHADSVKNQKAEALAARKAVFVKAQAEKAEQRKLAAAERTKLSLTYKDATGKTVYNKAETDPSYKGGVDAFQKYLKDNLKYPAEARDRGVEGTVFVDFIVDEKGNVREVSATDVVGENVDFSLKEEAVRVVALMPEWNPGQQRGKSVDASFSVPITFQIVD